MEQAVRAFTWLIPWFVVFLVAGGISCVPVYRRYARHSEPAAAAKATAMQIAFWLATGVILSLTLAPAKGAGSSRPIEWVPFGSHAGIRTEMVLNLALFLCLGLIAAVGSKISRRAFALALPLTVEVLQFLSGLGRVASTTDVLIGTVAVLLALLLARAVRVYAGQ